MTEARAVQPNPSQARDFDAIVIGAGMSGMYELHRLRQAGFSVRVVEAGDDVGGTWYWNRYPGARFDSESYSYGYSFSKEMLQEWNWSEHFAAQPETLDYLNRVADRLELRKDIWFGRRVTRAEFDGSDGWIVTLDDASILTARFLISAVGPLSAPILPNYPGVDRFQGEAYHPGLWPRDRQVSFAGKRVAVIGTGSTGVQIIQEAAKTAQTLTVFQRSPNWCAPLHNSAITPDELARIKADYDGIFARCAESPGAFLHRADPRSALEVSPSEREALYEKLYAEPGFGIWLSTFRDVLMDQAANDTLSEFIASKIRNRVRDAATAEKLIPINHGFGTRRVALETNYYEVYNQPNVTLVDVKAEPIKAVDEMGIRTSAGHYPFDLIVYATGFDAVVGSLNRIDIRGEGGMALKDKWSNGPETFLGMMVSGFPNFFMLVGPHNAGTVCNLPRCIEQNVEWTADLIEHMRDRGSGRVEVRQEAEQDWTRHVYDMADRLLLGKTDSWFTGVNSNIPGRDKRTPLVYVGGAPRYREYCRDVADGGYAELCFD